MTMHDRGSRRLLRDIENRQTIQPDAKACADATRNEAMTMTTPRIPLPSNVTPPFRVDDEGLLVDASGAYVWNNSRDVEWAAAVLTAYYADTPPQQATQTVPQFVVIPTINGELVMQVDDIARVYFAGEHYYVVIDSSKGGGTHTITPAEYARLKSILAPGQ